MSDTPLVILSYNTATGKFLFTTNIKRQILFSKESRITDQPITTTIENYHWAMEKFNEALNLMGVETNGNT